MMRTVIVGCGNIGVKRINAIQNIPEIEIVDLHNWFLNKGELEVAMVKNEWVDAGTFDSLLDAQNLAKEKLQDKLII